MLQTLYPAILYLRDGTYYKGWSFFKLSSCFGEVVFNTGMTGYQEILSDPSYSGQMVVFTYPELGNVGLNVFDNESNFIHVQALIARNISSRDSNWRSKISLSFYLKQKCIPHIFGVDTRSLTKYLRLFGVTNAILSSYDNDVQSYIDKLRDLNNLDLIRKVTTTQKYYINCNLFKSMDRISPIYYSRNQFNNSAKKYKILIFDLGIKFSIIRKLLLLNCMVDIVPATVSYDSILKHKPNGILLSNGPGDPILATHIISTIKKIVNFSNVPIFGICMGHQVLNIAMGASTFKLKFGHRGLNHPSGMNKYSEITSQNHGFAVNKSSFSGSSLIQQFAIKYLNLNDSTVSATFHKQLPIFSVQYHPESNPGPHDSEYLFQIFVKIIELITK